MTFRPRSGAARVGLWACAIALVALAGCGGSGSSSRGVVVADIPVPLGAKSGVTAIAAGEVHSLALLEPARSSLGTVPQTPTSGNALFRLLRRAG